MRFSMIDLSIFTFKKANIKQIIAWNHFQHLPGFVLISRISVPFFFVKTGLNPNAAEFHPCMWSSFGPHEKSWDGLRLMLLKGPTISKYGLVKNIYDDDSTRMMNDGVQSFLIFFSGGGWGNPFMYITPVCVFGLAWLGFVCLFEGENSGFVNS